MGTVTNICMLARPQFTWAEANAMLPMVKAMFAKHEKVIDKAIADQRFYMATGAPQKKVTECDDIVADQMRRLGAKLHKIGCKVLGNGYIGFDAGIFYWSYHQHDTELNHYHAYGEEPIMRHRIDILHPSYVQE
jgi:hypothetical protein